MEKLLYQSSTKAKSKFEIYLIVNRYKIATVSNLELSLVFTYLFTYF